MLSPLLEETGVDPKAKWLIAEGADSLALSRSVPMTKALDDARFSTISRLLKKASLRAEGKGLTAEMRLF